MPWVSSVLDCESSAFRRRRNPHGGGRTPFETSKVRASSSSTVGVEVRLQLDLSPERAAVVILDEGGWRSRGSPKPLVRGVEPFVRPTRRVEDRLHADRQLPADASSMPSTSRLESERDAE